MPGENDTPQAAPRAAEKKNKAFKIDRETAEAEFVSFCEANDIDCDMDGMNDEERRDFEPIKKRFIKACMQGRVTVDGRSLKYTNSEFTVQEFREEVTISRPSGHAFMAMDGYKETQGVHKLQGFVSSMTGKEVKYFSKIDSGDWLFYRDMAVLFLAG
jgi:hypothetical protein